MARQGLEKVRSGCLTCKSRKVKCDETRPICLRCKTARRECKGYAPVPVGCYSWQHLLRPQQKPALLPSADVLNLEAVRDLDFYRHVAAPAFCGPIDEHFWTSTVLQQAINDASTRSALMAISVLFERFSNEGMSHSPSKEKTETLALKHYNKALYLQGTSAQPDVVAVLLNAILFTCIEYLRGNGKGALSHSQHAVRVMNVHKHAMPQELQLALRQLSVTPIFFAPDVRTVPLLPEPQGFGGFQTPDDAGISLSYLLVRATKLAREAGSYGYAAHEPGFVLPVELEAEYKVIVELYEDWFRKFSEMRSNSTSDSPRQLILFRLLEARWMTSQILANPWVSIDPMASDAFIKQYQRIIELIRLNIEMETALPSKRKYTFSFSVDCATVLQFVFLKCRYLPARLDAFRLAQRLGARQESLWDVDAMLSLATALIETEHGIELTPELLQGNFDDLDQTLPPLEARVSDAILWRKRDEWSK